MEIRSRWDATKILYTHESAVFRVVLEAAVEDELRFFELYVQELDKSE